MAHRSPSVEEVLDRSSSDLESAIMAGATSAVNVLLSLPAPFGVRCFQLDRSRLCDAEFDLRYALVDHVPSELPRYFRDDDDDIVRLRSPSRRLRNAYHRTSTHEVSDGDGDGFVELVLDCRLRGGKGGFGSQLRAAGGRISRQRQEERQRLRRRAARRFDADGHLLPSDAEDEEHDDDSGGADGSTAQRRREEEIDDPEDAARDGSGHRISTILTARRLARQAGSVEALQSARRAERRAELEAIAGVGRRQHTSRDGASGSRSRNTNEGQISTAEDNRPKRKFNDDAYLDQAQRSINELRAAMLANAKRASAAPTTPVEPTDVKGKQAVRL